MADAHYLKTSLYRFSAEARDEVVARFDARTNNHAVFCRYDVILDLFEVHCSTDLGDIADYALDDIMQAYIDQEVAAAERDEREPKVQRFEESATDDFAVYTHESHTSTTDLSASLTGLEGIEVTWKPQHHKTDLLSTFPEGILAAVSGATGCSLTIDQDCGCIVIHDGDASSQKRALSELTDLETNAHRKPREAHLVLPQNGSGVSLRLFALHKLPARLLQRTLLPPDVHSGHPLFTSLPHLHSLRTVHWDVIEVDYTFAGRTGEPIDRTSTGYVWDSLAFEVFSNGPDTENMARTTSPVNTVQVRQWRFKGEVPTVEQWVAGMGETELEEPDVKPARPSDGLTREPYFQKPGLSRPRVPQGSAVLADESDEDTSISQADADRKAKTGFLRLIGKAGGAHSSESDDETASSASSDTAKKPAFRSLIQPKGKKQPPPPSAKFNLGKRVTVPVVSNTHPPVGSTRSAITPISPIKGAAAELMGLEADITINPITPGVVPLAVPVYNATNRILQPYSRVKKQKKVLYTPAQQPLVKLRAPPSHARAVSKDAGNRSVMSLHLRQSMTKHAPVASKSSSAATPAVAGPYLRYQSDSMGGDTSPEPIMFYHKTKFNQEPWAHKIVEAQVATGQIVDVSEPASQGPVSPPPGLNLPPRLSSAAGCPSVGTPVSLRVQFGTATSAVAASASSSVNLIDFQVDHPFSGSSTPLVPLPPGANFDRPLQPVKIRNMAPAGTSRHEHFDYEEVLPEERLRAEADEPISRRTMGQRAPKKPQKGTKKGKQPPSSRAELPLPDFLQAPGAKEKMKIKAKRPEPKLEAQPFKKPQHIKSESLSILTNDGDISDEELTPRPYPTFSSQLERILADTRAFRGHGLSAEIDFGLILLPQLARHKAFRRKMLSGNEFLRELDQIETSNGSLDVVFLDMLTSSAAEAEHILYTCAGDGDRLFAAATDGVQGSVTYEIDVSGPEGQHLTIVVAQDGTHSIETHEKLLGSIHLHFPEHVWDARFTISGQPAEVSVATAAVKDLTSTLKVESLDRGGEAVPVLHAMCASKELRINAVLLKRTLVRRSAQLPRVALHVTECRDLDRAISKTTPAMKASSSTRDDMARRGLLWYTAKLVVDSPVQWRQNEALEIGDEAAWTPEEVITGGYFDGLQILTEHMVSRMDGVGFHNVGPRGGIDDPAVVVRDEAGRKGKVPTVPFW